MKSSNAYHTSQASSSRQGKRKVSLAARALNEINARSPLDILSGMSPSLYDRRTATGGRNSSLNATTKQDFY